MDRAAQIFQGCTQRLAFDAEVAKQSARACKFAKAQHVGPADFHRAEGHHRIRDEPAGKRGGNAGMSL
eukprot:2011143-Pyramimonas_sp.AAC.1